MNAAECFRFDYINIIIKTHKRIINRNTIYGISVCYSFVCFFISFSCLFNVFSGFCYVTITFPLGIFSFYDCTKTIIFSSDIIHKDNLFVSNSNYMVIKV